MTWFEWIVIAWIVLAVLLGWRAGFIFTAGNFLGFLASLWVARHYGQTVASWFGSGAWSSVLSALGIVLVVTKLGGLLAVLVDKVVKITYIIPFIKTINRLAGVVLSTLTHLLAASLIAFLVNTIILEKLITQPWSKLMVSVGGLIAGALPNVVQKYL